MTATCEDCSYYEDRIRDLEARAESLREALGVAADDLGKAANQFASIHESQQHGHYPDIRANHHRFAEKADRASAALADTEKDTG